MSSVLVPTYCIVRLIRPFLSKQSACEANSEKTSIKPVYLIIRSWFSLKTKDDSPKGPRHIRRKSEKNKTSRIVRTPWLVTKGMNRRLYLRHIRPKTKNWKQRQKARKLKNPVIAFGWKQKERIKTVAAATAIKMGLNSEADIRLLISAVVKQTRNISNSTSVNQYTLAPVAINVAMKSSRLAVHQIKRKMKEGISCTNAFFRRLVRQNWGVHRSTALQPIYPLMKKNIGIRNVMKNELTTDSVSQQSKLKIKIWKGNFKEK